MVIIGWYYLHQNGELIYKRDMPGIQADLLESDLVRCFWPLYSNDRECAWTILVEAASLGAKPYRISELADKWHCDDADAQTYADRMGIRLNMDGDQWCATGPDFVDLQASPAGFGPTALEAMAKLCSALGFKGRGPWTAGLRDLVAKEG